MVLLFRPRSGVPLIGVAVGDEGHLMLSQAIWRQANADINKSGWSICEKRHHFFAQGGSPSSSNSAH